MAARINRGDIWLYRFDRPDKSRPVLVLTRSDAIRWLRTVMVAPITSTIRGGPAEVVIGVEQGLKHDSAINLDHVQTVSKKLLRRHVGNVGPERLERVCEALAIATGCDRSS